MVVNRDGLLLVIHVIQAIVNVIKGKLKQKPSYFKTLDFAIPISISILILRFCTILIIFNIYIADF